MSPSIDDFIARPSIRERHETVVAAPAEWVFTTACNFDLLSIPLVHAIFWLRSRFFRATPPPRSWRGVVEEMQAMGWVPLAVSPGRIYMAGAACQPWAGNVVFTSVPAERFAEYAEPDMVKIVWTLETEPIGAERTRLGTETRAQPTDEQARRKFRRYWRIVGAGIVLIRRLLLPAIRREAERRWRDSSRELGGASACR